MLFWLTGCAFLGAPSEPPTSHGRVLYAGADTLVVQHDDLRGRVVAGVERYRWSPEAVSPGSLVALWIEGEEVRRVRQVVQPAPPRAPKIHDLTGTVVNVDGIRVMVDHEEIPGVMGAMVMGFGLAPWEAEQLSTGDRIQARLLKSDYGFQLVDVEKTGRVEVAARDDVKPLEPGQTLPRTTLTAEDGSTLVLGEGQGVPTAFTYVYTRCPDPSFCPAIAARMAALQQQVNGARIVTVTIDPDHDTPERLRAWGEAMGADFKKWRLARAEPVVLQDLALRGGQHVSANNGRISHLHRLLVLDSNGVLIERYDDNKWPMQRVVDQLK